MTIYKFTQLENNQGEAIVMAENRAQAEETLLTECATGTNLILLKEAPVEKITRPIILSNYILPF